MKTLFPFLNCIYENTVPFLELYGVRCFQAILRFRHDSSTPASWQFLHDFAVPWWKSV